MQSENVEELAETFDDGLLVDTEMDKSDRYQQKAKVAAKQGDLHRALRLFQAAYHLQPSEKLQRRVQIIQDTLREEDEEEDEEEEFVNVNGSGLNLFKGLYDKLYDHQKDGVAFLYSLHRDGRKGGILADDMGLGKTIQVISFLSGLYDAELATHTLLVMPTSLIKNWVREFGKWTPGMRVKEFHGASKVERNRNLERIQRRGGVVITTYQMLMNNVQQLGSCDGREFKWDYVILDEAHKIKTSSTKTAKSAHAIPAKHRVLLTGTPVQNNLREMWALFDFACQGSLLGTAKTFKTEYENPITRAREKDATPGEKALGLRISQNLMDIIQPYFLRRTKADVQSQTKRRKELEENDQENRCPNAGQGAQMPSLTRKNDLIVWTYLSSVQEDVYEQFISLDQIKELLMTTRSPLAELTLLKKLCDHPRLLSKRAVTLLGLEQGSAAPPDTEEDDGESAASQLDHISDATLISESGKLKFLISLLECLREEGHRTLIFSQSRTMLDIMERVLRNKDFRLLRLDGTVTKLAEREKRITLFQTDRRYSVFLLTTQVGGVGITLTAATRVVIFDPSWNPATDAQAVDRAYRIGQTENVLIYRLITCGTVEEKIYRRQVFKDSLIRQTTGDKKNPFRYFSKQELRELFKLEDTRSSSTQQQLQSMHSQNRRSDTNLDHHIARLHSMEMFGISDHDLMFTKEAAADEDLESEESHVYIQTRVQKAQELMQAESEINGQLMDSVAQNTEPAWLRLGGTRTRERPASTRSRKVPVTVDLTSNSIDDSEQNDDPNMPSVEEVKVPEPGEASPQSKDGDVQKASSHVITLDDSLNESCSGPQISANSLSPPFPKLEDLSIASDHLEDHQVQPQEREGVLSSPPSPAIEAEAEASLQGTMDGLKGNFNLLMEDSADMFSAAEEDAGEDQQSTTEESLGFQLQMDLSGDRTDEASHHLTSFQTREDIKNESPRPSGDSHVDPVSKQKSQQILSDSVEDVSKEHPDLQVDPHDESLEKSQRGADSHSASDAENSFIHCRRTRNRVISDSEEEDREEESEKPFLSSSPIAKCSSTPNKARTRRSLNTSVASRRSFILSVLESDSEEEQTELSQSEVEESVLDEEEPSGETLDTSEGAGEDQEDDAGVELQSSEMMEQFAPEMVSSSDVAAGEDVYQSLVVSGKRCLAEGKKREALDFLLRAIDINSGDADVQLLIIQLYRQVNQ